MNQATKILIFNAAGSGLGAWAVVRLAKGDADVLHWALAGLGAWSVLGLTGALRTIPSPGSLVFPMLAYAPTPAIPETPPEGTPGTPSKPDFVTTLAGMVDKLAAALAPAAPSAAKPEPEPWYNPITHEWETTTPEVGFTWPYPAPIRAWNLRRDQPTPIQQIPTPHRPYLVRNLARGM